MSKFTTLKINDSVELFNGTKGIVTCIKQSNYNIEIDNSLWFHVRNIKTVNNNIIDNDYLKL
jgi:preprotein translocase subunit YajC